MGTQEIPYCPHCDARLWEDANLCPGCGRIVGEMTLDKSYAREVIITVAVTVAIVLACPLFGLVLSGLDGAIWGTIIGALTFPFVLGFVDDMRAGRDYGHDREY